ncbi:hypothetical protein D3C75_649590 [compost metagenome]
MAGSQFLRVLPGLDAQGGGRANRLPHAAAGGHHPGGPEGHMGGADVAARHQQIGNIAGIQAAEGNIVHPRHKIPCRSRPLVINALGGMKVHRPAPHCHSVPEGRFVRQVVLGQHIVPHQPSGLPLPRQRRHIIQNHIVHIVKFAAVFDVVPNTVHQLPQLQRNVLIILDDIQMPAVLQPP